MTTGAEVSAEIREMLDEQVHELVAARDAEAVKLIAHLVGPLGIDPKSRRLQRAMLACKTAPRPTNLSDSNLKHASRAKVFKAHLPELASQNDAAVETLASEVMELLFDSDKVLRIGRSDASIVLSVLRPLDTRWVARTATRNPAIDTSVIMREVTVLLASEIADLVGLHNWLRQTYDHFAANWIVDLPLGETRAVGMVRKSNERRYFRVWNEWVSQNAETLLARLLNPEMRSFARANARRLESLASSYSSTQEHHIGGTLYERQEFSQTPPALQPYQQSNAALSAPLVSATLASNYSIEVTLPAHNSASSTKSWSSMDQMLHEAVGWVSRLLTIRQATGSKFDFTLKIQSSSSAEEHTFTNTSLAEFESTLEAVARLA